MDKKSQGVVLPLFSISVSISLIVGFVKALLQIFSESYLEFSLYNISLLILRNDLTFSLLLALAIWSLVTILHLFLSRKKDLAGYNELFSIIMIFIFLFVFLGGGFYLNRTGVIPPFFSVAGFLTNVLYTVAVSLASFVIFLLRRRLHNLIRPLGSLSWRVHGLALSLVIVTALAILLVMYRERTQKEKYASIILISLDTLRADHLGCYGYERETSPHIDAFSKGSVTFRNAMSPSSWTLPSQMSLFTSQYDLEHGAAKELVQIDTERRGLMFAELLKDKFYTNAAYTGGGWLDPQYGFGKGFDTYSFQETDYRDPIPTSVFEFIEKNRDTTFFLFLHTYCIHNYFSPSKYSEIFDSECNGKFYRWQDIQKFIRLFRISPLEKPSEKKELQHLVNLYDASIKYVDDRLGALFQKLEELGIYDDLMIIITSDHGEEFGEHRHTFHGHALYNELIHIPLIVKFPGGEYAGTEVETVFGLIDLVPTILEYLGLETRSWMRGRSAMSAIRGESIEDLHAYSDLLNNEVLKFSLRTNRHHLIYETIASGLKKEEYGNFMLFDIVNDPAEQLDIAAWDSEIFNSLKEELRLMMFQMMPAKLERLEEVKMRVDLKKRLRAMGYVQ
ncbi:MAG: sulfatase [Candidatus Glassbacteria bacterium]